MNENRFNEECEEFAAVDMLVEWVRANAPRTQMLNVPRYGEVVLAKARLDRLLAEIGAGPCSLELQPLFGVASLLVELEDLEVGNISDFTEVVRQANNFEIYPLVNGKIQLAITFFSVMQKI